MKFWSLVALAALALASASPVAAAPEQVAPQAYPELLAQAEASRPVTPPAEQAAPDGEIHRGEELAPRDELALPAGDEFGQPRYARRDDRGGGGIALTFGWLWTPMSGLNDIARQMNFGEGFSGGPVQMSGLRGFGYIGRHFRVGGMAADGSKRIRDRGEQYQRDLILTVEQVGLTLEYVYPMRRWEFYGGGLLGSGAYRLTHVQTNLNVFNSRQDWDQTVNQFANATQTDTFTKRFAVNYLAANPWIGVKYKLVPWFAVDANVGYQWGRAGAGRWEFGDSRFAMANSPAVDGSGVSARLEATFGMFPQ
jgi:hypothetical protein